MRLRSSCTRRGVSSVLATICLICITLGIGSVVAGYTYTLFNTLQVGADVEAVSVACSVSGANCVIDLRNMGRGVVVIPGPYACTVYGTTAASSINGVTASVGIPPGQDTMLTCQFSSLPSTAVAGVHVEGTLDVSNGMVIPFYTNWNA